MLHMNERRSLCGVHPCDSSQLVGRCAGWVAANTRSKIYWWLAFTDHPSDHNIIWPLHFHWMNFSTRNRGLQLLVPSWHCFPLSLWRISRPSPTIKVTKYYIVNIVLSKLLGKNPGRPLSAPQPIKPLKPYPSKTTTLLKNHWDSRLLQDMLSIDDNRSNSLQICDNIVYITWRAVWTVQKLE